MLILAYLFLAVVVVSSSANNVTTAYSPLPPRDDTNGTLGFVFGIIGFVFGVMSLVGLLMNRLYTDMRNARCYSEEDGRPRNITLPAAADIANDSLDIEMEYIRGCLEIARDDGRYSAVLKTLSETAKKHLIEQQYEVNELTSSTSSTKRFEVSWAKVTIK